MTDKLGDIKVKKSAGDSLAAIAEKISLQFVFSQGTYTEHTVGGMAATW